MSSKPIVFVTGANTGLGYEIIKALSQSSKPYEIVVGARSTQKAEDAIKKVQTEVPTSSTFSSVIVDVTSDDSIAKASTELATRHGRLDTLINNAGAAFDMEAQKGNMSVREAFNACWDINVTGTHLLTHALIPLLLKSSNPRLLFITSGTSPLDSTYLADAPINKSPPRGWPKPIGPNPTTMYRSSKTGMNRLALEWNRILKEDGVKVFMCSPGFLATGLAGIGPEELKKLGAEEPHLGGQFIRGVVEGERDADTGLAISRWGIQPW